MALTQRYFDGGINAGASAFTNTVTINGASAGAVLVLNAATGNSPSFIFATNNTQNMYFLYGGGNFLLADANYGYFAFEYSSITPGASASVWSFNTTMNATSYTAAGFVIAGGLAVAKNICTNGTLNINGVAQSAQPTGFGTPTSSARVSSFPGTGATLAQCGGAISDLIAVLKTYGLVGA